MRKRYDFTKGTRGKFYKPGTKPMLPVYLDDDVALYLAERAEASGTGLDELANRLLRKEIELIKAGE